MVRVAIREQLAVLVILAVLVALAIVSIPTWIYVHSFVVGVEAEGLALTASLKASRIAAEIELAQTICQTVATRVLLQRSLVDFYAANGTADPFDAARLDLRSAMSNSDATGLLQARIYSRNTTDTGPRGLLSVTSPAAAAAAIHLPYADPDGAPVLLGDTELGYPPSLYPNITYRLLGHPNPYEPSTPAFAAFAFPDIRIGTNGGLLLGPLVVNESYALLSVTVPIRSLDTPKFVLGFLSLVLSARTLVTVQTSREGLGDTGMVLLVGPAGPSNRFDGQLAPTNATYSPPRAPFADAPVRFVLPPVPVPGQEPRHSRREFAAGDFESQFMLADYPAAFDAFYDNATRPNNAAARISTTNEQDVRVAVGLARPRSTLVDWAVIVEKAEAEAYAPISTLSKILLACVFGTAGLVVLIVFPCAHLSVQPIRRLKAATEKSISPPGYDDGDEGLGGGDGAGGGDGGPGRGSSSAGTSKGSSRGILAAIRRRLAGPRRPVAQPEHDSPARVFKIPGRVHDRRHLVTDELTELTQTFNEMADELLKQYTSLDKKVAERTRQLDNSKRAAEAANQSKTLFIANISHELKTPLNGIMGMCAVCMEEDDITRIKQSLKTLYRSGAASLLLVGSPLPLSVC